MAMTIGQIVVTGGVSTFVNLDNSVRSVQPDGSVQSRPAGANGLYEAVAVNGLTIASNPQFQGTDHVFVWEFFPTIPNKPGYCAIGAQLQ